VLIAIGADLKGRRETTLHKLKTSRGIGGRSKFVTCWRKDARDTANLVNAKVPKYTARILFLRVIPYILRRNRISQSEDKTNAAYLNAIKTSEDVKENEIKSNPARYVAIHLSKGLMSPKNCHLQSIEVSVCSLTQPVNRFG